MADGWTMRIVLLKLFYFNMRKVFCNTINKVKVTGKFKELEEITGQRLRNKALCRRNILMKS